jgi:hypothetical protein
MVVSKRLPLDYLKMRKTAFGTSGRSAQAVAGVIGSGEVFHLRKLGLLISSSNIVLRQREMPMDALKFSSWVLMERSGIHGRKLLGVRGVNETYRQLSRDFTAC